MRKRLNATKTRYEDIERELASDAVASDVAKLTRLSKEKANLEEAYQLYSQYLALEKDVADSFEMENSGDPELSEFAKETRKEAQAKMGNMEADFKTILLPKDPNDEKNIIVEIRGAVGWGLTSHVCPLCRKAGMENPTFGCFPRCGGRLCERLLYG